jgi:hypothetical protein
MTTTGNFSTISLIFGAIRLLMYFISLCEMISFIRRFYHQAFDLSSNFAKHVFDMPFSCATEIFIPEMSMLPWPVSGKRRPRIPQKAGWR